MSPGCARTHSHTLQQTALSQETLEKWPPDFPYGFPPRPRRVNCASDRLVSGSADPRMPDDGRITRADPFACAGCSSADTGNGGNVWRDQTHPAKAPPQGRTPASRTPRSRYRSLSALRRRRHRRADGNTSTGPRHAAVQVPYRRITGFRVKHRQPKDSRGGAHGRHPHGGHARTSRVDVSPHPGIP